MKELQFKDSESQKMYTDYMNRVKKAIKILSIEDQKELLMEMNSHIFEGMQRNSDSTEPEALNTIIKKLGDPGNVLKPEVAERKLKQATNSFNPKYVIQALFLNLKNGLIYGIFGLLYLFLACFGLLIFTKIIKPTKTGLFYIDEKFHSFGFIADTSGTKEVLGHWFIPLILATILLLYFLITLLFRLTRKQ